MIENIQKIMPEYVSMRTSRIIASRLLFFFISSDGVLFHIHRKKPHPTDMASEMYKKPAVGG
jgi:uncharacterized membrane protein (UPF0127 family)